MADSGIKKTIIKFSELPDVVGDNDTLSYNLRYRVVSEDRNRFSHWSPISTLIIENTTDEVGFDINDPLTTSIPHQVVIEKSRHVAECSWTMPALLISNPTETQKILQQKQAAIKEFDVYVSWQSESVWSDWVWVGKSNSTQFSINYSSESNAPSHIKFRIQKVTLIKKPFDAATYLISEENEL